MAGSTGPFSPAQPCTFIYGDGVSCPSTWGHPGAVVIGGRINLYTASTKASFQSAAAAGARVFVYLNTVAAHAYGKYHAILYPGGNPILAPEGRTLQRVSFITIPFSDNRGTAQRARIDSAFRAAFDELPWLAGAFCDDLGSGKGVTSPGASGWTAGENLAFRDSAISASQIIRGVCDEYGKICYHNAGWAGGSTFPNAGGYPDFSKHGCNLCDGWVIEHHDGEIGATPAATFWDYYIGEPGVGAPVPQWKRPGFGIVIASDISGVNKWKTRDNVSHITPQPDGESYNSPSTIWGSFHPITISGAPDPGGGGGGGGGGLALPSTPTGISVTPGNGQITVSWTANASIEEVDLYQVYVNDSLTAPSKLDVTATSYTITGLTNGTSYGIRVSAHNATGYGNWSTSSSATPVSTAPLAPTSFTSGSKVDKTIALTLVLPTDATRTSAVVVRKATPFAVGEAAGSTGVTTITTLTPGSGSNPISDTVPTYGAFYYRAYTQNVGGTKTYSGDLLIDFPSPVVISNPTLDTPGLLYWGARADGDPYGRSVFPEGDAPFDLTTWDIFVGHAGGKTLSIVHFGQPAPWDQAWSVTPFANCYARGAIPLCAMGIGGATLTQIVNGVYDSQYTTWFTAAKNWGKPFFLCLMWEMNGTWFPHGAQAAASPATFVAAWRKIHTLAQNAGATNVTFAFVANTIFSGSTALSSLYPGDTYVDWIGIDGYNWGTNPYKGDSWKTWTQVYDPTYQQLVGMAPSKPLVIQEMGCTEFGGNKAAWITDAYAKIGSASYSHIRAVSWFNWNIQEGAGRMDWPIESSPAAQAAFAAAIAPPKYSPGIFTNPTPLAKVLPIQALRRVSGFPRTVAPSRRV